MKNSFSYKPEVKTTRRDFMKNTATFSLGLAAFPEFSIGKSKTDKKEYNYVIIGAGSSGCVLANRLTEDPSVTVLLLEAGGPDSKPEIHEASKYSSLQGSEVDWGYSTEKEPFLNNRQVTWPRGKVLGGSSAINAMIYVRGHYSNYDDWLRAGNTGWGYRDTLPYFKKLETNPVVDANYHGNEGPLIVSYKPCPEGGCGVFIEATMEMGYDGPDWNFNGSRQENGSGLYQLSVKDGIRQSAATAFLDPALSRPNLEVETFAQVTKLHFSGKRVAGVEYLQAGRLQQVYTTDEVIVSAGAVETPKILMLSGIGPEDHLRAFGIKVISNLPGVGNNLQDHLSSGLIYEANSPIPTLDFPECAGLFTRTKYASSDVAPDLQFMFYHLPGTKGNSSFLFLPILASPRSRGNITLKSTNPYHSPVIHANYFKQEEDVEVLVEGFKLAEEIADTKTFRMQRYGHGKTFKSEKQIKEYIYNSASTMYHPVGTCKMGKDNMAVVQPDLTVYGVHGVRIADASIMPSLINANTNATCLMIGEYASDIIKGKIEEAN